MSGSGKSKTPTNQRPLSTVSFKHPRRNGTKDLEKPTGDSNGPLHQPAAVASSSGPSRGGSRVGRSQSMKESSRKGSNVSDHPAIIFSLIDITELRADVIVCPAGSNLRYDAGIAGDVMKKAGPGLKRALADYLRGRRQPLPVGEAFVTGSFDLKNCDHIIHVVVPKFSEYATEDECAFDLKRACDNSFKQLSEVKRRAPAGKGIVRSMGLATLGSGKPFVF